MNQEMVLPDGSTVLLIHFLFRAPAGTTKLEGLPLTPAPETWKIACTPNLVEVGAGFNRPWPWRRTDDARAVSCPLCRETEEYKKALVALNSLERQ